MIEMTEDEKACFDLFPEEARAEFVQLPDVKQKEMIVTTTFHNDLHKALHALSKRAQKEGLELHDTLISGIGLLLSEKDTFMDFFLVVKAMAKAAIIAMGEQDTEGTLNADTEGMTEQ